MPTFEITSPDGKKYRVTGPEGSTREQALAKVKGQQAQPAPAEQPAAPAERESQGAALEAIRTAGNIGMGALSGAAGIGATLLTPIDYALQKAGLGQGSDARRASLKQFFAENADPETVAFKGGELAAEIAGTAGAPGLLGKVAKAGGAAPKVVTALQSGGFNLGAPAATTLAGRAGDAALRVGAGAAGGAAMAGIVDPESAGTGAMIGGALPPAVKAAGAVGSGIRSLATNALGSSTGVGSEAIKQAYKAGQTGSKDFLTNLRGQSQFDDVLTSAKQGIENMRAERAAQYRGGMVNIKGDKSVLDMTPITQSIQNIKSAGFFKGKAINEKAAGTLKEIADKVDDWAQSAPTEYHTPEGLDALKKAIGDIRDTTQFGTPARRAADEVYNSIKSQIQKQAPTYAKVMKDYSQASEALTEIEKTFSLGKKALPETALRKLQAAMRNNVNTSYGKRLDLLADLEKASGKDISSQLAGQAMQEWTPRGIQRAITGGGVPALAVMGEPITATTLAAVSSPRLVGEALYGAGRMSGATRNALARAMGGQFPAQGQGVNALMQNPVIRNALIQANLATP